MPEVNDKSEAVPMEELGVLDEGSSSWSVGTEVSWSSK